MGMGEDAYYDQLAEEHAAISLDESIASDMWDNYLAGILLWKEITPINQMSDIHVTNSLNLLKRFTTSYHNEASTNMWIKILETEITKRKLRNTNRSS